MNYWKALSLVLLGLIAGWWLAPRPAPMQPEPAPAVPPAAAPLSLFGGAPDLPASGSDQRLQRLEEQLRGFAQRLDALERRPMPEPAEPAPAQVAPPPEPPVETVQAERERSSRNRVQRLSDAGLAPATAEYIDGRLQEYELQRLYLRDRAVREGWFGTTRYTDAVSQLAGGEADLRQSLDESEFDLYLYATGQPNRLVVGSVMDGSAAADNGLQANDVIYRYAGERVFNSRELRELTAAGFAGETVPVEVQRNGELLLFYLPRGPVGVRLNLDRVSPN